MNSNTCQLGKTSLKIKTFHKNRTVTKEDHHKQSKAGLSVLYPTLTLLLHLIIKNHFFSSQIEILIFNLKQRLTASPGKWEECLQKTKSAQNTHLSGSCNQLSGMPALLALFTWNKQQTRVLDKQQITERKALMLLLQSYNSIFEFNCTLQENTSPCKNSEQQVQALSHHSLACMGFWKSAQSPVKSSALLF